MHTMKTKSKIMIGAFTIVLAIGYLFVSGFSGNTSVHVNLKELAANPEKYDGMYVQTEGKLVKDSVNWDSKQIELRFSVSDSDSKLPVLWKDIKPDNFSGDVIVMVGGKFRAGEDFDVDVLTTKCPSKYESEKNKIS